MRQAAKILILTLFLTSTLTGCWDRRDLEQRTSVIAKAFDKNQERPELIEVTLQIPIPIKIVGSGGGGGGEGGQQAVRVISDSGRTILDAEQNLQKRLNQPIFWGHLRMMLISDQIATEDMADILDVMRRSSPMRRLLWPVVVPGRAAKLLKVDPKLEQIPILYVKEMLDTGVRMGTIPDLSLREFFISLSDTSIEPMMHFVTMNETGVKWDGLAVFKGSKMVGRLTADQVWAYMNLREKKRGGDILIPCFDDPNRFMTFHPRNVSTDVNVQDMGGTIHVSYRVKVEGDISESECSIDYNNEQVIDKVQAAAAKVFEQRAKGMIELIQKDFKADVLGVGSIVRSYHPEIWKRVNWDQEFPNVKIDVKYHVNMRRFGMRMGR